MSGEWLTTRPQYYENKENNMKINQVERMKAVILLNL
jgi:hypothetical protein